VSSRAAEQASRAVSMAKTRMNERTGETMKAMYHFRTLRLLL
jgi:hypothetical protein